MREKPMKLVIDDGQTFAGGVAPKIVKDAIALLDKLEDGQLFTSQGLAVKLGRARETVVNHSTHPALAPYRFKVHTTKLYFGSKRTVKEAQRQFKKP